MFSSHINKVEILFYIFTFSTLENRLKDNILWTQWWRAKEICRIWKCLIYSVSRLKAKVTSYVNITFLNNPKPCFTLTYSHFVLRRDLVSGCKQNYFPCFHAKSGRESSHIVSESHEGPKWRVEMRLYLRSESI